MKNGFINQKNKKNLSWFLGHYTFPPTTSATSGSLLPYRYPTTNENTYMMKTMLNNLIRHLHHNQTFTITSDVALLPPPYLPFLSNLTKSSTIGPMFCHRLRPLFPPSLLHIIVVSSDLKRRWQMWWYNCKRKMEVKCVLICKYLPRSRWPPLY